MRDATARRVALLGRYATYNFGDQLIRQLITSHLLAAGHYVAVPWAVERNPHVRLQRRIAQVLDYRRERGILSHAQVGVFGGGGYLTDSVFRGRLVQLADVAHHWYRRGVPYALIGVGAGPVETAIGRQLIRNIGKNADCIAVRDEQSKTILTHIIGRGDIQVTADWAHNLGSLGVAVKREPQNFTGRLGIHLQLPANARGPTVQDLATSIVWGLGDEVRDATLVWVVDGPDSKSRRRTTATDVMRELRVDRWEFVDYTTTECFLSTISQLDGLITTKLHAGLVAHALGVPAASFAVHPKTHRLFERIGRARFCASYDDDPTCIVEQWAAMFIGQYDLFRDEDSNARGALAAAALKNASILDQFVQNAPRRD